MYKFVYFSPYVEYVLFGEFRDAKIKSWGRKKVLLILDRIRKIRGGALPGKSKRAPCEHCVFVEMCNTRKSLLSKFFGE
ncbi:MAG: hypothetical protein GKB99_01315 [Methanocellales archaeon]|nr:hypothetical protein [Methanocellales archaeon]